MAAVSLKGVSKAYPNGVQAVSALDLDIADGEFMVIVGPSGCGKTTVLRMVAGLEEITDGTITFGNRVVNGLTPRERDVAMIFQNYALYPHMTVAENIGFALSLRKMSKEEIKAKVDEAASILGLTENLDRKPSQLSGGQRQRVAMGRAIVREPAVFLMDEPLSNLDAKLRVQMRAEVSRIQRHLDVATLYVTHDQTEAMTMGDRVAVMRSGILQQSDAPQRLYDHPVNMFVATFIGSPAMNLYEAKLAEEGDRLRLGQQWLPLPASARDDPASVPFRGRDVVVGIRPENLSDAVLTSLREDDPVLEVDVEVVESLGSEKLVHFRIDAGRVHAPGDVADDLVGEEIDELAKGVIGRASMTAGVARVSPESSVRPGEKAKFQVDVQRLHLFDGESGRAIHSPG